MRKYVDEYLINRDLDFYFVYEYDKRKLKKYIMKLYKRTKGSKIGRKPKIYIPEISGLYMFTYSKRFEGDVYIFNNIGRVTKNDNIAQSLYRKHIVLKVFLEIGPDIKICFSNPGIKNLINIYVVKDNIRNIIQ